MDTNDRRYEDAALREAIGRISEQSQQEPLPEDFEQRVISRMAATKSGRRWMQAVAVFIGVLTVSVVAFAAWQLGNHGEVKIPSSETQNTSTLQTVEPRDSIVRFDNVRLDSVLTIIGKHYGRTVEFRKEPVRHLRFLIEWNREAPLSQFIELINNFEGIYVTEANDTIFAE